MTLTVAQIIDRYVHDAEQPGMKRIGGSHRSSLSILARSSLGPKRADQLKKHDVLDYARTRRVSVQAPTVAQEITYLSGCLKYAGSAWAECEDVTAAAVDAAKPMLTKLGLIGKSTPRKRVPTGDELERLMAYFAEREQDPRSLIAMRDIIAFALASTRRIGEICRIQHGDIDWGRKAADGTPTPMYMVRDLKHPKKKLGNHKWFPLFPDLAEIIRRQPRLSNDPAERVFPFNPRSASAAYTKAKAALGITDLRFHDNRRAAITRWLAVLGSPHKVKQISGHETTHILERVYDATDPATLHHDVTKLNLQQGAV